MKLSEKKIKVTTPEDIGTELKRIIHKYKDLALQEGFYVCGLNVKNVSQYIDMVALGTLTNVTAHPRDIFREAIRQNVNCIIIAHNHPSGCLTPSNEDIKLYKHVKNAGEDFLGIRVLDSIIFYDIADKVYSSEMGREVPVFNNKEKEDN